MSVNNPPNPNVATFNNLYWISSDTSLTQSQADLRYLKFPVAQGTENLQAINVNGTLTASSGVNFTSTNPPTSTATQPASTDSSTKMPTTAWVQSAITSSSGTNLTPNSITMTPTTLPPTTDDASIKNYYNNGALYALNIRTPYYLVGSSASTRRQNFVRVYWSSALTFSVYQTITIDYKNYMTPDDNIVAQPNNGKLMAYDYGTISFSPAWLIQQYSTGTTISSANSSVISFTPCSRGSINNGSWTIQANIIAEYLGSAYNYITLYFNNAPIGTSGGAGAINTWCSFTAEIKNTSTNTTYPIECPVWFVADTTTSP